LAGGGLLDVSASDLLPVLLSVLALVSLGTPKAGLSEPLVAGAEGAAAG
jgi:hypothetical protein